MNDIPTLLVDDDKILLDGLIHMLDWHENGFDIVATASNGVQAFRYFQQFHPQLVITDVVMPVMNGITLLKEIRKIDTFAYILMLSSYDDFDYAKQSLNFQANGYILKDEINAESLQEKLLQIKHALTANLQQSNIVNRKLIFDYFNFDNREYTFPQSHCQLTGKVFCHMFLELPAPILPVNADPDMMNTVLSSVSSLTFWNLKLYMASPVSQRHILLLYNNWDKNSLSQKQYAILHTANTLKRELQKMHKISTTVLYSINADTLEACKTLYDHARLSNRYFNRLNHKDHIINIHQLDTPIAVQDTDFDFHTLNTFFETNDFQGIRNMITHFFQTYTLSTAFWGIEKIIHQFVLILDDNCYHKTQTHICTPCLYTYEEFIEWYLDECQRILLRKPSKPLDISMPVKLTIENINKEYPDSELNIAHLAKEVYLSPGYLSTIFKAETGKSINEFITEIRIKRAKVFLRNPELKIYHIATLCGYSSSQYFSQIFQKYTGMTPKQYRRNIQNE